MKPFGKPHAPERGWGSLLPDLIGFSIALVLAWALGWRTGDVVWSMWLTSLVIGYSLILWKLFGPLFGRLRHASAGTESGRPGRGGERGIGRLLIGKLILLVFFSLHFGGFHWAHSLFVNGIYPITPPAGDDLGPTPADYWSVVTTYGWFLPLAFLAQRGLFRRSIPEAGSRLTISTPESRSEQGGSAAGKGSDSPDMGAAYKGVVKLHLLIFFLLAADETALPEFAIYSVVYFVYFFPWTEVFGRIKSAGD